MFQTSTRTMWPVLMLLMWEGVPLAGSQCERSSAVRFSVSSWRNQTGHRLVAAELRSDDSLEDAVSLSVDQWTERCGAAGTVALSMTASSAGSTSAATTPVLINTMPTYPFTITYSPVTDRTTPRPDYRHLPGMGYYKLHSHKTTWDEARRSCESEGAYLAVPDSREELDALYNLSGCCTYIGVHRQDRSSPWMTVLGQPLNSGFQTWRADKPSEYGDCAYLSTMDGIANVGCTEGTFVCEFKV